MIRTNNGELTDCCYKSVLNPVIRGCVTDLAALSLEFRKWLHVRKCLMLENSQNWRRKQGQAYTTRPKDLATDCTQRINIVRASYIEISFKTLKLIDAVVKDASSLQHFSVLFNIFLPCCLLRGTGSRRGRTSRSSTDASSLESTKNGWLWAT